VIARGTRNVAASGENFRDCNKPGYRSGPPRTDDSRDGNCRASDWTDLDGFNSRDRNVAPEVLFRYRYASNTPLVHSLYLHAFGFFCRRHLCASLSCRFLGRVLSIKIDIPSLTPFRPSFPRWRLAGAPFT